MVAANQMGSVLTALNRAITSDQDDPSANSSEEAFSKEVFHFHSARLAKMEKRDPRQGVEATSMRCPRIPIAWRT
jgi:hypothetical protein